MVGQRGAVWFLAGGFFGANVTRSCSVPEGKTLFFPITNESWFNTPDCGQSAENFSVKKEISLNKPRADHDKNLRVTLDSHDITKTAMRRIQSIPFAVAFPEKNIFGPDACAAGIPLPAGIYSPSMDDGYYVLIPPLRPRPSNQPYVIHFHGESPDDGDAVEDVTYNVTIVPVSLK